MRSYLISYILAMISGGLTAAGVWRYAKAVVDTVGTLGMWIARMGGIVGLGAALWFAGRPQVVGIIVLFFATSGLTLVFLLLARKRRMR